MQNQLVIAALIGATSARDYMSLKHAVVQAAQGGFDQQLHLIMEPQTLGGAPILSDIANRLLRFRIEGSLDQPHVGASQGKDREEQ